MARNQALSFNGVQGFLEEIFADDLHAKRILSLAGATAGVLQSGSLAFTAVSNFMPTRSK